MKRTSILSFCLLLLVGCSSGEQETAEESPAPATPQLTSESDLLPRSGLSILQVRNATVAVDKEISGRVQPRYTTQLAAEVQGLILPGRIDFRKGVTFRKGDLLLQIDRKEFEYNLKAQRSQLLDALSAILPDLRSDYPEAFPAWSAYASSFDAEQAIPEMPKPQSDQEKFFLSTYQIYSQYFAIKALEERLSKYQIRAPFDGIFTQTLIDAGSLANPGQALGTIISRNNYELEAGVDLALSQAIKIGDKVQFRNEALNQTFTGTLVRNAKVIDPATQSTNLYFRISGKNLSAGMYLTGNRKMKANSAGVSIPNQAYKRDGTVLLLREDQITPQPVEILDYLADSLVVSGLDDGDLIILNQFQTPVIGTKVSQ
ncbi:MAG: HlyD family efflux transporter periplasmic adaptor subunit [Bacteroidota bacterium]